MIQVIKRDGSSMDYHREKIIAAVQKANKEVPLEERATLDDIHQLVTGIEALQRPRMLVEDIQDLVEEGLSKQGKFQLSKKYIIYRYVHSLLRPSNTTDSAILALLRNENKELAEENSNKNTMIAATQRDYIAGEVSRDLTRRILLDPSISESHEKGEIHFHDADYFVQPIFNCCLINIGDMLDNGTVMNGKLIESPRSFQVACTVMTQIIACVASNQYGGQSVDLKHLGKYLQKSREKIKKSVYYQSAGEISEAIMERMVNDRLKDELKSGVQTIQYQINTLMTTNGQSPFVTLFLNLDPQDPYLTENALIVEEVLKQRLEGIKNERGVYITPAFPKLVYTLDEHNNLHGGQYDHITKLAVKCSAKRMYPDYISTKKMKEHYEGNVFSPMGCRSFLSPWKNENGEFQFEGRFNQGVVSLNLPQIGIIARECEKNEGHSVEEAFWNILDQRLEICYKALMARHNALKQVKSDSSPVHWQYGAIARLKSGDSIEPFLYNGYSSLSLGYIGIYEATKLVIGESHTHPDGEIFAMKLMVKLQSAVETWAKETNIGFGLYGTPAESLCYRFARVDKERFGSIPDITDKGYYTNSYHVDVREEINAFDKFTFEAQFQKISKGGCISYAEVPNMQHNLEALEEMVRFIYHNIQYAEFNTKSDYCHKCKFDGEIQITPDEGWKCPDCGNTDRTKMNVTRRTCGYLGENFWNEGKTKEISSRVLHVS